LSHQEQAVRDKAPTTRKQREAIVENLLAGCDHLGAMITADDEALCHLLAALGLTGGDRGIGEDLGSYLRN
jgi:hypothetical protein